MHHALSSQNNNNNNLHSYLFLKNMTLENLGYFYDDFATFMKIYSSCPHKMHVTMAKRDQDILNFFLHLSSIEDKKLYRKKSFGKT